MERKYRSLPTGVVTKESKNRNTEHGKVNRKHKNTRIHSNDTFTLRNKMRGLQENAHVNVMPPLQGGIGGQARPNRSTNARRSPPGEMNAIFTKSAAPVVTS